MPTLPNSLFDYSQDSNRSQRSLDEQKLDSCDVANAAWQYGVENQGEPCTASVRRCPQVLIAGTLDEAEFPQIRSLLESSANLFVVESSDHCAALVVDSLVQAEAAGQAFDLVIYAQPRQAISLKGHDQILEAIETSKHETMSVQLLGTWCEGEGRNGILPEHWQRVFWHAWPRWWDRWVSDWSSDGATLFPVNSPAKKRGENPAGNRTIVSQSISSDAEASEGNATANFVHDLSFHVVEAEGDQEMIQALHEALLPYGLYVHPSQSSASMASSPRGGQVAGIWIGSQLSGREAEALQRFCHRFQPRSSVYASESKSKLPVVALLDFPRRETVRAGHAMGVSEVLGLPCDTLDLVHALKRAIAKNRTHSDEIGSNQSELPDEASRRVRVA